MATHQTLGLMMVREGVISRPQLYEGMRRQRQTGELIGNCLVHLGFISATQLLDTLSRQLSIPALPAGAMAQASQDAADLVPAGIARSLSVAPFSWDGSLLVVAVSHGKSVELLAREPQLADYRLAAYLALDSEIEEALNRFYPDAGSDKGAVPPRIDPTRPRPIQAAKDTEIGGIGDSVIGETETVTAALVLSQSKGKAPRETLPEDGADDPIPLELEVRPFLESIEKLYEKQTVNDVGRAAGQGLGQFFSRVAVGRFSVSGLHILGYRGFSPAQVSMSLDAIPSIAGAAGNRAFAYGTPADDRRIGEIATVLGVEEAPVGLIATVGGDSGAPLFFYGDNGEDPRIYDDLHDIELLLKEVETALEMLNL